MSKKKKNRILNIKFIKRANVDYIHRYIFNMFDETLLRVYLYTYKRPNFTIYFKQLRVCFIFNVWNVAYFQNVLFKKKKNTKHFQFWLFKYTK